MGKANEKEMRPGGGFMDIRMLKYFIEIVRRGSFTRAAEALYISQPMLTKSIQQLEQVMGMPLIDRGNKHFRLTDAGEVLYQGAEDVCMRFEDLHRRLADLEKLALGKVELAVPPVLLNVYLGDILREFRQKHTNVELHITEVGSKTAARMVCLGEVDLAFVTLPVDDMSLLTVRTAMRDGCVVVMSKQHKLAARQTVHLIELHSERMVTFERQFTLYDIIVRACESAGFAPNIVHTASHEDYIVRLVTFNEGLTIMPRSVMETQMNSDIVMVPLEPAIPWEAAFITRRGRYLCHAAKALIESSLEHWQRETQR